MKFLLKTIAIIFFGLSGGTFLSLVPFAPYASGLLEEQRQLFWTVYAITGIISAFGGILLAWMFYKKL